MNEENNLPFPDEMDEEELGGIPVDIIDEDEKIELFKWMTGMVSEPPAAVQKIAANLATKINLAMGYVITRNFKRIDNLLNFMEDSEEYLFDAEELINMDDRDMMIDYYKEAGKQMKNSLEWMRKYVYQNKDELKQAGENVDKLKSLLMSLPPDKLEDIIDVLEKGDYDKILEEKD